jgi:hypothetical protein
MRPITGVGKAQRLAQLQQSTASAFVDRGDGRPAEGRRSTGSEPEPIWLCSATVQAASAAPARPARRAARPGPGLDVGLGA